MGLLRLVVKCTEFGRIGLAPGATREGAEATEMEARGKNLSSSANAWDLEDSGSIEVVELGVGNPVGMRLSEISYRC
jgi:hypothetical protein